MPSERQIEAHSELIRDVIPFLIVRSRDQATFKWNFISGEPGSICMNGGAD